MAKWRDSVVSVSAGLLVALSVTAMTPAPAAAQGLFEQFFGGLKRAFARPAAPQGGHAFTDPFTSLANAINPPPARSADASGPVGGSRGYCVRSCDGHYFPVQAQANMNMAETCQAYCPSAETRVYFGGNIDSAQSRDGGRYSDSNTAFLFRKQIVNGCSCNGKTPFGLAHVDVKNDPTLRPGDIVASKDGLLAYSGRGRNGEFTPVAASSLSKATREQLSAVKIQPTANDGDTTASTAAAKPARNGDGRVSLR